MVAPNSFAKVHSSSPGVGESSGDNPSPQVAAPSAGRSAATRANLSSAAIYPQILCRIASAASLARGAKSPAGPTQEGHPDSQLQATISSRACAKSNSCARYNGSEKPIPPGYASNKCRFGSKSSFSVLCIASSIETGANASPSTPGFGGRSPIAVPKSRPSHISNNVATDFIAYNSPNIPLCRSLIEKGSDSTNARSSVSQYEVVCISFSGNSSLPAPIFSFVKNFIFLNPTTWDRTNTSPCDHQCETQLSSSLNVRDSPATSNTRTCVYRTASV